MQLDRVGLFGVLDPFRVVDSSRVGRVDSAYLFHDLLVELDVASIDGVASSQLQGVQVEDR